ncbi:DUF3945 domain-containing protein [Chryseobacterium sp. WX]|uniref:DUF3945 domain-containing protein n=1 Tax=Chryseobacterium sp. WX TaxID=3031803 RepID=UPI00240A0688|nr:DUF3945 domain-containing protein [Chryseobacterium sp. WX]WFB69105.1 DUF3945 domain-containing protein [Chryseobacterium sp. WX]
MNNTGNYTGISELSTLLVLRHSNNKVGLVQAVGEGGELVDTKPDNNGIDAVMRFDASADSFAEFYIDFYHRLKEPDNYSFFKVREFEAYEAALGLQAYLNNSSYIEKEDLKRFEVSIETVETFRNKKKLGDDAGMGGMTSDEKSSFTGYDAQYRYQIDDVDWNSMADIGLNRSMLQELGALQPLMRGFKSPMLVPILSGEGGRENARLQLRLDDNGEVVLHVHRVKRIDFRRKFLGHRFSKEDRLNLLNSGNMGRVVDLVNPVTGEVVPSLVSRDKLTNELFSLRMEFVRIPEVICGVTLSADQQEILRSGKPLFVENMVSKHNMLFNATVQFNAEKQWLEFFFNLKLKGDGFEWYVPTTYRGVKLRRWQIEKLKAGEAAYIRGLVSKNGKKYQGYIRFDKEVGRIVFSFKKAIE